MTLKYLISTAAIVGAIGSAYAQSTPPPATDSNAMPSESVSPVLVVTQTPTIIITYSPAPYGPMTRSAVLADLNTYRESGFDEFNRGDNIDPSSTAHAAALARYGQLRSSTYLG